MYLDTIFLGLRRGRGHYIEITEIWQRWENKCPIRAEFVLSSHVQEKSEKIILGARWQFLKNFIRPKIYNPFPHSLLPLSA
jgi:hypothetical protein